MEQFFKNIIADPINILIEKKSGVSLYDRVAKIRGNSRLKRAKRHPGNKIKTGTVSRRSQILILKMDSMNTSHDLDQNNWSGPQACQSIQTFHTTTGPATSQSVLGRDIEQGRAYSLRTQSQEGGYYTCDEDQIWKDTPSGQHDRFGIASMQRPSVSPRTTVSTNILYNTTSVIYGAPPQQSENTDNNSYSGGFSYPVDRDDPHESAQGDTDQNLYDVEQPVTSTPERTRSPRGTQGGAFGDQTSIPQYISGAGVSTNLEKTSNLTMSWRDSRAQTPSIPLTRQEFKSNKNIKRRSSLSDLKPDADPIVIKKEQLSKNYRRKYRLETIGT